MPNLSKRLLLKIYFSTEKKQKIIAKLTVMVYNTRSRKLACKGLRLRSISRNVVAKSIRFGGELPKAIGFASETSKAATFVIIQELKCSVEHFGAERPCEFLLKNSHSFLKFSVKMPANALRLRIFA